MGWAFSDESAGETWLLAGLDQLQRSFGLDEKSALIPQKICIVGEDAVIGGARDRYGEGPVHIIGELKLEAEAHRFIEFPAEFYPNFLLGDADVESIGVVQLYANICDVIEELAFEVAVFVAVVENPEGGGGLDV
jgi:hypothetical protein